MKLFRCKFSWCLFVISVGILLISQSKALAEEISASAEEGQSNDNDHNHHPIDEEGQEHHHNTESEDGHAHHHEDHPSDDDASTSGEVASVNQDDPHPENHDHDHSHHLLGHGEACDAESGATCNTAAGLICVEEVSKCECNKNAGEVYSSELGKCEQVAPQVIHEVHDNSLESDSGDGEHDDNNNEKGEHEHEHDGENKEEIPSPTTTTTTKAAVVKENSLEAESMEDETLGIQHRAEEDKSSEETGVGSPGKCANVNCEESLGKYSKCDEETGECLCNDVEDLNRSLVLKDGKCFINRHINDPCTSHDDCTATIAGKAWCHMDVATFKRFCQCEMWHYYDESQKECLPFASDGLFSPCKTDMQCTGNEVAITGHGLGPNARCSQEKNKCECKMGPNGQKAFLYENYCFYQMMPGEYCNLNRECEVSFPGQDVACIDQQCMCKNGENITAVSCPLDPDDPNNILGGFRRIEGLESAAASEDGSEGGVLDNLKSAMGLELSNFVFIMIIGAVVLLAVVIISVVILRRRHRYSVVSREEPQTP